MRTLKIVDQMRERIEALENSRTKKVYFIRAVNAECPDREPNHASMRKAGVLREWSRGISEDLAEFKGRISDDLSDNCGWVNVRLTYRWL